MTLKEFIKENGPSVFFNFTRFTYPAPFDDEAMALCIAKSAARKFGGLMVKDDYINDVSELANDVYAYIMTRSNELATIDNIASEIAISDEIPSRVIEREYGADATTDVFGSSENTSAYGATSLTTNIGARASTDSLGAQHSATVTDGTAYDTIVGKLTGTSTTDSNAITNGTTSAAATDTQSATAHTDTFTNGTHTDTHTRAAKVDTESIYNNVSADNAPDVAAKWANIAYLPIGRFYQLILIDTLVIPYYE